MKFSMENSDILIMSRKKQITEAIEPPNEARTRTPGGKGKLEVLSNVRDRRHKTIRYERQNNKRVSQKNEKTSRNQALQQKSFESDRYLSVFTCTILATILEMDEGRTSRNGSEYKRDNGYAQAFIPER